MNNFKRIVLATLLAIVACGVANAQFKFGIKAGMNVNRIHITENIANNFEPSNSTGWTAGVTTEFTVPLIGVGADVSVMYARMNNSTDETIGNTTVDYGKNFLEIPVHVKYKLSIPAISSVFAPYIFTGPNFAFKLDKNVAEHVKSKDCQVGWDLGLGIQLVRHLQIGAGYTWGMNHVFDKVFEGNYGQIKARNNYWTITAAYLF